MHADAFRGHVVIVTGASAGIGKALTQRLAGRGAKLAYLKQTKGRIVAISSMGGKAAIPYNTPYIARNTPCTGSLTPCAWKNHGAE
jgi:short-subunit dehydrogenase